MTRHNEPALESAFGVSLMQAKNNKRPNEKAKTHVLTDCVDPANGAGENPNLLILRSTERAPSEPQKRRNGETAAGSKSQ